MDEKPPRMTSRPEEQAARRYALDQLAAEDCSGYALSAKAFKGDVRSKAPYDAAAYYVPGPCQPARRKLPLPMIECLSYTRSNATVWGIFWGTMRRWATTPVLRLRGIHQLVWGHLLEYDGALAELLKSSAELRA